MTPYELRFEIFKQAQTLADHQHHTRWEYVDKHKELDPRFLEDFPTYPSFEYIEKIAEDINKFVSKK
jgi:hypothetical protein